MNIRKNMEKQNIIVVQPHLKLAAWSCVSRSGSSCSKLDTERTWAAASVPKHFKWMALFAMRKKTYPVPAYTKTPKNTTSVLRVSFSWQKSGNAGQTGKLRALDFKMQSNRHRQMPLVAISHSVPSGLRTQLPICRDSRFCSLKAWLDTRNLDFVCHASKTNLPPFAPLIICCHFGCNISIHFLPGCRDKLSSIASP